MIEYSDNAIKCYDKHYIRKMDKNLFDVHARTAQFASCGDVELENKIKYALDNKLIRYCSPVLMNAMTEHPQTAACFVGLLKDDLISIFDFDRDCGIIYKNGSGMGINTGNLRETNAELSTGGRSSGPFAFNHKFASTCWAVRAGGINRRAAFMNMMYDWHPDVWKHISFKEDNKHVKITTPDGYEDELYSCMNFSVAVSDAFMNAVDNNEMWNLIGVNDKKIKSTIGAVDMFKRMAEYAWKSGCPGIWFIDRANKFNTLPSLGRYDSPNACVIGDTLILVRSGYIDNEHKFYPIGDLVNKEVEIWNGFRWTKVTPQKTGTNEHIYRIDFKNVFTGENKILYCTDYHRFLLQNGSRIKATQLSLYDKTPIWKDPFGNFVQHEVVSILSTANYDDVYCFMDPWDHTGVFNGVLTCQCSEQSLHPYENCALAAVNLSEMVKDNFTFDYDKFADNVRLLTETVDSMIDISIFPTDNFKNAALNSRNLGIGFMGMADMLIKVGIPYNSIEARKLMNEISRFMTRTVIIKSSELAMKKGTFPLYEDNKESCLNVAKEYFDFPEDENIWKLIEECGLRNSNWTTVAPNGTTSISCDCSSGMEPIFSVCYLKQIADVTRERWYFINPLFEKWLDDFYKNKTTDFSKKIVLQKIAENHGSVQGIPEIPEDIQNIFICAHDITWKDRIDMQSAIQEGISNAISSTLNLPNSTTIEEVEDIYRYAYFNSCVKGLTVYRDGSKANQPLQTIKVECKEDSKLANKESYQRPIRSIADHFEYETSSGSMHVEICRDENDKIFQVLVKLGKQGTLTNLLLDALSRCISKSLQYNAPLSVFAKTLRDNKDSPFWVKLNKDDEKSTQVESIVDLLGIIFDMVSRENAEKVEIKVDNGDKPSYIKMERCPSCGEYSIIRDGSCRSGRCTNERCQYTSCG